jgi:hypothetical protein
MVVGGQHRGKRNTGGGLVSILGAVEGVRRGLDADPEVQRGFTAAEPKTWWEGSAVENKIREAVLYRY